MRTVAQMVKGNQQVFFVKIKDGEVWYKTECGFEFPIPFKDLAGAEFLPQDKALYFMRWITPHIKEIENARQGQSINI